MWAVPRYQNNNIQGQAYGAGLWEQSNQEMSIYKSFGSAAAS